MQRCLGTCLPTKRKYGFVPSHRINDATEKRKKNALKLKSNYDKSAKDLPPLTIGCNVRVYNHKTSKWDIGGKIVLGDFKTGRSYRIMTTNDVCIFRNRTIYQNYFAF